MRNEGKYIIGGGLSGLIWAYYNPEFKIISPEVGGKLAREGMANTIFLHACEDTERLLIDTGTEYEKSTRRIKYFKGGKVMEKITEQDKLALIRKKMMDVAFEPKDFNLSTGDYYIDTFEIDFQELIQKLSDGASFVKDEVIRITDKAIVSDTTSYTYDEIVSTIPADIFWELYHRKPDPEIELASGATTFVLCDRIIDDIDPESFSVMYFVDDEYQQARVVTRNRGEGPFLYEFPGQLPPDVVASLVPGGPDSVVDYWIDPRSVIMTNLNNVSPERILFAGRFANWDHRIKIGDVVRQAKFDIDFRMVWNRQMNFTRRFHDFNRLADDEYRDQLTKNFILHLYPEIGEILDGVNYKIHREAKVVDEHAVKMEIVDVFKYVLNLMIAWGITPEELFRLFDEKSSIVEDRYRKLLKEKERRKG